MRAHCRGWTVVMILIAASGIAGCQQDENLPNYTAATQKKQQGSSVANDNTVIGNQDRGVMEGFTHGGASIPELQSGILEVGQGDCFVIGTPGGRVYLIDGGPPGADKFVLDLLQKSGVEQLAGILITNWNADHAGALPQILKGISVGIVYGPDLKTDSSMEKAVRSLLAARGKSVLPMHAGQLIPLDDKVKLDVLAPTAPTEQGSLDTTSWMNNNSIVMRVSFGESRILFASSMSATERDKLITSETDLRTPVLVLADHGSRQGTDAEFLSKVTPKLVMISCGSGNAEGTPHAEVLDALKERNVSLARTDLQGTIFLRCEENGHISAQPSRAGEVEESYHPGKAGGK